MALIEISSINTIYYTTNFFLEEQILIKNRSFKESKKKEYSCVIKYQVGIKIGKISKTLTILGGTILVGVSYSLKK